MEITKVKDHCYICSVSVNRGRTQQEAIDATGCKQYTDRKVVDAAPRGKGGNANVVFFKPEADEYTRPGHMSDEGWDMALTRRGLVIAPLDDVAAVNEADVTFVDGKPHGTHWKDDEGNWCYATFSRWISERKVDVRRDSSAWSDDWWLTGVPKSK